MSIRLVVYIFTFVMIFITGIFVLLNNNKNRLNQTFFAFVVSVDLWVLSLIFADNSSSLEIVMFASRAAYVSAILMSLCNLYLSYIFPNKHFRIKKLALILVAIPSMLLIAFAGSSLVVQSVSIKDYGADVVTGPIYILFFIYLVIYLGAAMYNYTMSFRRSKGAVKVQVQFLLIGILISAIIAAVTNLVLVVVGISSFGYLGPPSLLVFIGLTAFAIVKHKLFDIRAVVARSVTYILSIGVIAVIYSLVAFQLTGKFVDNLSHGWRDTIYVVLTVILAFSFAPLRRFFEKISNRVFYRDHYDTQQLINEVGRILASEIDLDKVSNRVLHEITSQIKIDKAEVVVFGEKQLFYENNVFKDGNEEISSRELRKLGRVMTVADDLQSGERKELLQKYGVSVSLALRTSEKFIGYMLLGEKKSGDIYNDEDIKVLKTIANEVSIAMANALSYKEIQLFSETLAERVRQRTAQLKTANDQLKELDQAKDEFISMASHQLRTPLTTVKGYASMLEEGDFGKLSKEQKDTVTLTLDGANRMARLIDDLLNVSRMDANRFFLEVNEVDLNTLVEQEVQQLQSMAASKHVKLTYTPPHTKIPKIRLDETKTRQVVMNLVDNAIHYSRADDAEVQVAMKLDGSHVVFTVVDNGIGVPAAAQGKLFTKMFRAGNAKTARPDGTGLGLYLVKRVVQDEGGELLFESAEGKGSTFGFRIPLTGIPKSVEEASKKIGAKVAAHPR